MKLKRKLLAVITAAATVLSLCACSSESGYSSSDSGKLKIISTVFPPYDLARQIAGDNAEISILLPPGSEIHNYEPSAKDMIAIRNCDIFLYIGGENEQWAEKLINSNDTENVTAVKLIDYVPTLSEDEDEHDHDHDHDHEHEHDHAYLHAHGIPHSHGHVHENQKAVLNRLSRAIGHLEKVKRMVEEGHDCSEVLIQLAAVRSALDNTGKVILKDHMRHCMVDAVAAGDQDAIDDLCQAIDKFMK